MKRKCGYLRPVKDERDFPYRAFFSPCPNLPLEVSHRKQMSVVEDQGQIGSCTANALVAEGERQFRQMGINRDGSRLGLYYDERAMRGQQHEDSGAFIRDGIQVLAHYGMGDELIHRYEMANLYKKPSSDYYKDAYRFKIGRYYSLSNTRQVQDALARGFTVSFGIELYSNFNPSKSGIISLPNPKVDQEWGGHAMQIIGYKTIGSQLYFEVRNSWGAHWGNEGHCFLPAEYVAQGHEFWVYEFIST